MQAELLARTFLVASGGESLTQLARRLGADPATIQSEVIRLERAVILRTERVGKARIVRPDETSPIYNELCALLGKTLGPAPLLAAALGSVAGVERAYIFGSWARRYRGEAGELPRTTHRACSNVCNASRSSS